MKPLRYILLLLPFLCGKGAYAQWQNQIPVDLEVSPPPPMQEDTVEVFNYVEQMPQFPGGMEKYREFIRKNINYPDKAKEVGIEGAVYIAFIIGKDGNHYEEKVIKSPDSLLSDEALRVIKLMPAWEPGMQNGKPVHTRITLPIKFELAEEHKGGGALIEKK